MDLFDRMGRREKGQGLVEYGLILALVSVIAVGALGGVGDKVTGTFSIVGSLYSGGIYTEEEINNLVNNEDYIPISTADELNDLRNKTKSTFGKGTKWEKSYSSGMNKKYIQVSNIDLGVIDNFNPIGTDTIPFSGVFDGGNYTIKNLRINSGRSDFAGMFGYVVGAKSDNINLDDVNVNGVNRVAGLVGWNRGTVVKSCSVSGVVSGSSYVGGITGVSTVVSEVIQSMSSADINGRGILIGGLVGLNRRGSLVLDSYSIGQVNGRVNAGGLVGTNHMASSIINSYAIGDVESNDTFGGFVGDNEQGSIINSSYYSNNVVDDPKYQGVSRLGKEELLEKSLFIDWDFDDVWRIDNGQYPTLQWQ